MEFYVAALLIVAGVALYVAAPLTGGLAARKRKNRAQLELARWEHEYGLAVQGLRELEFDREMRKLSDVDYGSLRAALEARALEAMAANERLRERGRAAPPAGPSAGAVARWPMGDASGARRVRFCPQCGARAPAAGKFCAGCGAALRPGERLATRA